MIIGVAQATINGEVVGEFDSSPGSTFTALGIQGVAVETLTLTSVGLAEGDWISFSEVSDACRWSAKPNGPAVHRGTVV